MSIWKVPIEIDYGEPGGPGFNVWHVRVDDAVPNALQLAVDNLHSFYSQIGTGSPVLMRVTNTYNLGPITEVTTDEVGSANWTQIVTTGTDNPAPDFLSLCIAWKTTLRARRGMGRTFIGPLSASSIDSGGHPEASRVQKLKDAVTTLAGSSGLAAGWSIGVWGLVDKAPKGTTDYASLPHEIRDITSGSVKTKFASLRSRRD